MDKLSQAKEIASTLSLNLNAEPASLYRSLNQVGYYFYAGGRGWARREGASINPHKGGRTNFLFGCRMRTDEKRLIENAIEKSGLSKIDWLIWSAQQQIE